MGKLWLKDKTFIIRFKFGLYDLWFVCFFYFCWSLWFLSMIRWYCVWCVCNHNRLAQNNIGEVIIIVRKFLGVFFWYNMCINLVLELFRSLSLALSNYLDLWLCLDLQSNIFSKFNVWRCKIRFIRTRIAVQKKKPRINGEIFMIFQ